LLAMRGFDRRAALAELHPPTLLVSGDLDRVAPLSAWPALARTRLARLPGVGHLPNLEAPDAFDALLLDFLSEARPPVWH
ncbi:MAG: alpha/beta hydrolase, partial [Ottowia sp.]|nr:alpha/beta hydrolase [Ottowia sp.]